MRPQTKKHRLRILFDGVIAIGPLPPQEGTAAGPLFGVMAHSTRRKSDRALRMGTSEYIPMHVPTLYTRAKPVSGSRPPDQVYQQSLLPKLGLPTFYVWHPIRERLEFEFDGDGTPGTLTYDQYLDNGNGKGAAGPAKFTGPGYNAGEIVTRSVHQVPNAGEIWPARSHLLPGMLDADVGDKVAAQIFVPWGDVCGGGQGKKGAGVKVRFDPAKPNGLKDPKIVVPNVIVTVEAKSVKIVARSLDNQELLDPIVFNLTEDSDIIISNGDPSDVTVSLQGLSRNLTKKERAAVEKKISKLSPSSAEYKLTKKIISNTTYSGIGLGPGYTPSHYNRPSDVDIDFELFYSLLEGQNRGGLPIPTKIQGEYFPDGNCYTKMVAPPRRQSRRRQKR